MVSATALRRKYAATATKHVYRKAVCIAVSHLVVSTLTITCNPAWARGAACVHLAWWPELSANILTLASTVHAAVVAAVEATAAAQHEKLLV